MYSIEQVLDRFGKFMKESTLDTYCLTYPDGSSIDYKISFNYEINGKQLHTDDNKPLFKITNFPEYIKKLTILINIMASYHIDDKSYFDFNDDNFLDYLIVCIVCNMNEQDFNNALACLDKKINSYKTNYNYEKKDLGTIKLKDKELTISKQCKKNQASMESPAHVRFTISDGKETWTSPKIHYYMDKNKCYIMAIQSTSKKQDNRLSKDLDRFFRKFDKGLEDIEKSPNGEVNTPKDISPSFLAALTMFMASNDGISEYYMIDFLPVRYINKEGVLIQRNESLEELERIQTNITNKFLFTGVRLCMHFDNSSYDLNNGYLEINFNDKTSNRDNVLFDFYDSIKSKRNISKNK